MKKTSIINLVLVATITAACGKKKKIGKEEDLIEKFIYVQIQLLLILKRNIIIITVDLIMPLDLIVLQKVPIIIQKEQAIIQMQFILLQIQDIIVVNQV
ncbi:hypothetical protein JJC03_13830 [Flavobacterium oreochromis]|uniref:hypothetical protein n=1 Tax=Flavobacterium oreochromis TaxID=2906078 RepID=UPI001CE64A54|nr:hypothetical protein [Flavobacterium oreochromis]QYS86072.1 hypothetical protein JJC03_13830 [Flavobacterium oreochromis]